MLPQEQLQQLRVDELTKEMEAMRLQLKQLQEERERAQKIQGKVENAPVANVNKWTCNPLLGVAVNYALTTGKRLMDKPIIPKDSMIRNKLTLLLHAFDTKLKIDSKDQPPVKSTISRMKTSNARTQTRVAPYTTDKAQLKRLTMQDALSYLDKVKLALATQPEAYKTFLDLMQAYKNGTTSFTDVITKTKQLFSGHPELMNGFSTFLPPGYKMNPETLDAKAVPPIISDGTHDAQVNNDKKKVTCNFNSVLLNATSQIEVGYPNQASIDFMKKVKRRFQNEPEKYRSFLKILLTFREKVHSQVMSNNDVVLAEQEVTRQIAELFKKNEDLAIEFAQNVDCSKKENSCLP